MQRNVAVWEEFIGTIFVLINHGLTIMANTSHLTQQPIISVRGHICQYPWSRWTMYYGKYEDDNIKSKCILYVKKENYYNIINFSILSYKCLLNYKRI